MHLALFSLLWTDYPMKPHKGPLRLMGQPTHATVRLAAAVLQMRCTEVMSPARAEIQPPSSHALLPCEFTCALQQRPGTQTGQIAPWTQRK